MRPRRGVRQLCETDKPARRDKLGEIFEVFLAGCCRSYLLGCIEPTPLERDLAGDPLSHLSDVRARKAHQTGHDRQREWIGEVAIEIALTARFDLIDDRTVR